MKTHPNSGKRLPSGITYDPTKKVFIATIYENGRRVGRPQFDTLRDAERAIEKRSNMKKDFGSHAAEYTPDDHALLKELRRLAGGSDLVEIVKAHAAKMAKETGVTFEEAAREYEVECRNLSDEQRRDIHRFINCINAKFPGKLLSELTGDILDAWLKGPETPISRVVPNSPEEERERLRQKSARQAKGEKVEARKDRRIVAIAPKAKTVLNWKANIGALFNWTIRKEYLASFVWPYSKFDETAKKKSHERGILSPEEWRKIFEDLAGTDKRKFIPEFALRTFAGIRGEEVGGILWDDINLDDEVITIRKEISKTDRERVIHGLFPALFRMLRKYKAEAVREDGGVLCIADSVAAPLKRRWMRLRLIRRFPVNASRHSFATFHLSLSQPNVNFGATRFIMGHDSEKMLEKHYVNRLFPVPVAKRFFEIEV